jgi:hypothetical protein
MNKLFSTYKFKPSYLYSLLINMVFLSAVFFPSISHSDLITERTDGVYVEDAFVTAANKGDTAIVSFKITNFGLRYISLRNISAPFAETGNLLTIDPETGAKTVGDLMILEEETLDFSSSHLRSELYNVSTNLVSGTNVEIEFVFAGFTTTGSAHVH